MSVERYNLTDEDKLEYVAKLPLFAQFSPDEYQTILPFFHMERFGEKEYLYRQAEFSFALYLIVEGGAVRVRALPDDDRRDEVTHQVWEGDYAGERSLFLSEVRADSLIATEPTTALVLTRRDFDRWWRMYPELRLRLNIRQDVLMQRKDILLQLPEQKLPHIRRLPLFSALTPEEITQFAGLFDVELYRAGEYIYRQGENSYALYLFVEGRAVQLFVGPDGIERRGPEDVDPGEFVGERTLFMPDPRPNSLVVAREAVVLVMPKARFDRFIADHPEIKARLNIPKDVLNRAIDQDFPWLEGDEQVLLYSRRHIWAFWRRALWAGPLFVMLLPLLVSYFLPFVPRVLAVILTVPIVLFPLLWMLYCYLDWKNDWFVLTNRRIVHEENVLLAFHETREQALLTTIQSVSVDQSSYWANRLGFGNLIIATAGAGGTFTFEAITEAEKFRDVINKNLTVRKSLHAAESRDKIREQIDNFMGTKALSRTHTADLPPLRAPSPPPPGPVPIRAKAELFWQRIVDYFDLRVRWEKGPQIFYRKHWIVLWRDIFVPLFWTIINIVLLIINIGWHWAWPWVRISPLVRFLYFVISFPILLFWLWWAYEDWRNDQYIVDAQFIKKIHRRPLWLQDDQSTIPVAKVQGVTTSISGIWQKMFDYGSVNVQTAAEEAATGAGVGEITFDHVYKPRALQDDIVRRQQRERQTEEKQEANEIAQEIARWLAVYHQATHPDDFVSGDVPTDKGSTTSPDGNPAKQAD